MLPIHYLAAVGSGAPSEIITLNGSNGSPVTFSDFTISPGTARAEWEFRTNGEVWREKANGLDTQYNAGVSWSNRQPTPGTFWIKATQSGVTGAGDVPDTGDSLDVWLSLSVQRQWGWQVTGSGFQFSDGVVRVDIATDSGGTNIVATGYYGGNADMEI